LKNGAVYIPSAAWKQVGYSNGEFKPFLDRKKGRMVLVLISNTSNLTLYEWNLTKLAENEEEFQLGLLSDIITGSVLEGSGPRNVLATEEGYYLFIKRITEKGMKIGWKGVDKLHRALSLSGNYVVTAGAGPGGTGSILDFQSSLGATEMKIVEKIGKIPDELHIIQNSDHTVRQLIQTALEGLFRAGDDSTGGFGGIKIIRDPFEDMIIELHVTDWSSAKKKVYSIEEGWKKQQIRNELGERNGYGLFDISGCLLSHRDLVEKLKSLEDENILDIYEKISGVLADRSSYK
jgi:hypothetical protein